jgi:hypothetical protein
MSRVYTKNGEDENKKLIAGGPSNLDLHYTALLPACSYVMYLSLKGQSSEN